MENLYYFFEGKEDGARYAIIKGFPPIEKYINKEDAVKLAGFDNTKASDWGVFIQLMYDAVDDICFIYKDLDNEDIKKKIGFNTDEYEDKRNKYPIKERPIKYQGYEYINQNILNLIRMKANTEESKKYRIELLNK